MGPWNRVWIFFVIVAVGLVLSWGQVGRKAERRQQLVPGELLRTEAGCDPWRAPCAALGGEHGLVLGPDGPAALRLRYVGATPADHAEVLLVGTGAGGPTAVAVERLAPDGWRLRLPQRPPGRAGLRVRLGRPAVTAEFPLSQ